VVPRPAPLRDPRVTDDKFGIVFLGASAKDEKRIKEVLKASRSG
jgi:hypothetical protein